MSDRIVRIDKVTVRSIRPREVGSNALLALLQCKPAPVWTPVADGSLDRTGFPVPLK